MNAKGEEESATNLANQKRLIDPQGFGHPQMLARRNWKLGSQAEENAGLHHPCDEGR